MKSKVKSSPVSRNGFPEPKKVGCFKCQAEILVKFVIPRLDFSKKNDFYHWTNKEKYKGLYVCDKCILNLYKNEKLYYLSLVENPKKRQIIRTYIYDGTIS